MVSGNETLPAAEDSSEFMTSVYSFRGVNEFTKLPTMKHQHTFEKTVKTFRDSLSQHTYSEYPIKLFSKWSCGFIQINRRNKNNRDLLPQSLQERDEGDGGNLWWVSVWGDDNQYPRLLCLPSGQFTKKPIMILITDSDDPESDGSNLKWCRFPALMRTNEPKLRPCDSDMDKAFSGLDMLHNLLPKPLGPLLPPGSVHLHGDIHMENRDVHGSIKGKKWMSTGELEMMTALLMRDGRYDDSVGDSAVFISEHNWNSIRGIQEGNPGPAI